MTLAPATLRRRRRSTSPDPNLLLGALSYAIVVLGEDNAILFANPAAEQFFDQGASHLMGQTLGQVIPVDSPVLSLVAQARKGGASVTEYDVSVTLPRNGTRLATVQAASFGDDDSFIALSFHEQTLARKMDRQLTHRNAARSVTAMSSVLAHEVKNPLSGIRGAAQLLEQSVGEADRELTRLICDEADRVCALVDRMSVFGEPAALDREPVNIHAVLHRVRRIAEAGFASHVRFSEVYDPSLPPVLGHSDELLQVFLNLVKNAAEAVPAKGGEIVLSTAYQHGLRMSQPGGRSVQLPLVVSVQDNGGGVPDDLAQHMFDPFVTTKANGTGLGLALVAKVIGDHGGVVEFDSQPRRTVFRVMLPVMDGEAETEFMTESTILVADDDRGIRTVLTQALTRRGHAVRATGNASTLWRWVEQGEGDVVITDVVFPDENGLDLLPRIRKLRPDLRVIVMSAQNTLLTAVKAAERGAFEYLPKPFDLNEVLNVVDLALAAPLTPAEPVAANDAGEQLPLIGRSAAMQEIYRVLARLMGTDLTVMITGESGTGKELVAQALHTYGKRRHGPFVAINMAAIPRELVEAELFGHEKGSFTGATARGIGRFEQAQGGTLFLDEIGDMPIEAQTRLLRVLQSGEYTTVGGRRPIRADVRIVAATHRDLRHHVQQGLFREDLFFRLNVVPIRLPPLRERTEDIAELAQHFFTQAVSEGLPQKSFSTSAMERLKRYRWPGNVRELENLVRRLAALHAEDVIGPEIVDAELSEPGPGLTDRTNGDDGLGPAVERHLSQYFNAHGDALPSPGLYDRVLREIERPLFAIALSATRGNQIRAAKLLGLNRNTLRKKIRDLDIPVVRGVK